MKLYRVKQIDENKFIPQVCSGIIDYLFNNCWKGVSENQILWYHNIDQEKFCLVDTLDKAKCIIEEHKQNDIINNRYPKYHKA